MEGPVEMTRDDSARMRGVAVGLSQLAFDALLAADAGPMVKAPPRMKIAVRCYLGDKGAGLPAWAYPDFLRGSEGKADVEVSFDVEEDLWREFETEAGAQGVSVDQLAEHAAFYFAAEANAGKLTQRILEDLGDDREG